MPSTSSDPPPLWALADCNNFYASCEQLFRPDLLNRPVVVLSTASPYKFPEAVLRSLGISQEGNGFAAIAQLEKITGVPVPQNLRGLDQRPVLHRDVIDQAEMLKYVLKKAEEKQWNK